MKTINAIFQKVVIGILVVLFLQACKKSDSTAPQNDSPFVTEKGTVTGDISSASIGASGGVLQSVDGNLTVSIPSGALSTTTSISIQPISSEAPLSFGSGFRLLPEGTTFSKPVTITFHYTEQFLQETPEDFLWIVTQAGDGTWNAMLKSIVDKNAKTVSIETTHFSDWALGKFIDFKLAPANSSVLKGKTVELHIVGFSRNKALNDNDELAPLPSPSDLGDGLTPLTPIPPLESRLMDFKVKQWTMNGAPAPVSNSNGSLSVSGNSATYTAPNKKPTINPIAVTVQLETSNKEGKKASYLVTSSINVVDEDLYVILTVDGQTYEYYQYGFNGIIPPDPKDISIAHCGSDGEKLSIVANEILNSTDMKNSFAIVINNPSATTRSLVGFNKNGSDEMTFMPLFPVAYKLDYTKRTPKPNNTCETEELCGNSSVTLTTYNSSSTIEGSFSGTIYEDNSAFSGQCKSAVPHSVSGKFRLFLY